MLVTQRTLPHVCQLDGAFRAGVHEPVATDGVEFGSSDNFCQLFHIRRLNVNNIEALVLNIQIPEVDPEVIAADEGLAITIHGNAVDVICVGIRVGFAGNGGHHGIMMRQSWEL